MRSNTKLGLILLILVMFFIALIEATKKEKINWRQTYSSTDKIPYGTYVLKNELRNILPTSTSLITVGPSLYTFLEDSKYESNAAVLFIGSDFSLGEVENKKLLSFVEEGGAAFISTSKFNLDFVKNLQIGHQEFSEYEAGVDFMKDKITLYLSSHVQDTVVFDKIKHFSVFNKVNKETTTILGYAKKENVAVPNFIKVDFGKGVIFLHLEPDVFTNYYMLQKGPLSIVYHSLQYINGRQILWYDGLKSSDQKATPLRFVLSDRALSSAWYLLLIALMFYLIFKGKREQRAIPVVESEPNLSIDFAKTIGSLYYENGMPGNMVLKKIEHFLFEIRKQYYMDTSDLSDIHFIKILSQRTAIPEEEVELFLEQIRRAHAQRDFSIKDLKSISRLIEQFKQKANLI